MRITVIGGNNVDIFATSARPIVAHDSNPGTVRIGFGGVGRNIAENLARLGQEVFLLTAFGGDPFSREMRRVTDAAGVNIEHSLVTLDAPTPYYISVNDSSGDMHVAVSDMDICRLLSPAFLNEKRAFLDGCDAVIFDANLPIESISAIVSQCSAPLFADAVSTGKAVRLTAALPRLHAVNANLQETEALLRTPVTADLRSLKSAADRLHGMGVACVLITLGGSGAFLSANGLQIMMDSFMVDTRNANGCGDAFSAAAFLGILQGRAPETILGEALAAAAITAQSAQAVSEDLSASAIRTLLQKSRKTQ